MQDASPCRSCRLCILRRFGLDPTTEERTTRDDTQCCMSCAVVRCRDERFVREAAHSDNSLPEEQHDEAASMHIRILSSRRLAESGSRDEDEMRARLAEDDYFRCKIYDIKHVACLPIPSASAWLSSARQSIMLPNHFPDLIPPLND